MTFGLLPLVSIFLTAFVVPVALDDGYFWGKLITRRTSEYYSVKIPLLEFVRCKYQNLCNKLQQNVSLDCFLGPRREYRQCQNGQSTHRTCPDGMLFNELSGRCQHCPLGNYLSEEGDIVQQEKCKCHPGYIRDYYTGECFPCPRGGMTVNQTCRCFRSFFDRIRNECIPCPEGVDRLSGRCTCRDPNMSWNDLAQACLPCPGNWMEVPINYGYGNLTYHSCKCPGEMEFVDRRTMSCVTCPEESILLKIPLGRNYCRCIGEGSYYNYLENKCERA